MAMRHVGTYVHTMGSGNVKRRKSLKNNARINESKSKEMTNDQVPMTNGKGWQGKELGRADVSRMGRLSAVVYQVVRRKGKERKELGRRWPRKIPRKCLRKAVSGGAKIVVTTFGDGSWDAWRGGEKGARVNQPPAFGCPRQVTERGLARVPSPCARFPRTPAGGLTGPRCRRRPAVATSRRRR